MIREFEVESLQCEVAPNGTADWVGGGPCVILAIIIIVWC